LRASGNLIIKSALLVCGELKINHRDAIFFYDPGNFVAFSHQRRFRPNTPE